MAAGNVLRHGKTDAAGAGAQIQHAGALRLPQALDDGGGQHLRVRAGNEHPLRDVQRQAVELPLADQIRHRLAGQMALHQCAGLPFHRVGNIEPAVPAQLLPALAGGAAHQLPRLQCGGGQPRLMELLADI